MITERSEGNERKKVRVMMTTNINGQAVKKTLLMRVNAKLIGFIELYEEIFGIDLHVYRLKFIDRNTGG